MYFYFLGFIKGIVLCRQPVEIRLLDIVQNSVFRLSHNTGCGKESHLSIIRNQCFSGSVIKLIFCNSVFAVSEHRASWAQYAGGAGDRDGATRRTDARLLGFGTRKGDFARNGNAGSFGRDRAFGRGTVCGAAVSAGAAVGAARRSGR